MSVWAVIMAAGRGSRFGASYNKVFVDLYGIPVLARCLSVFEKSEVIYGVILVAGKDDMEKCAKIRETYAFDKLRRIVVGGDTRQTSVYEGLKALPDECDIVLVHDGARPFVTEDIIASATASVREHGSGVTATAVTDTLKIADGTRVVETPDRSRYYSVQTPQGFIKEQLMAAYESAASYGISATDDSALVERLGVSVHLSPGSYENIKITSPSDMAHAKAILKEREGQARPLIARVGHGYDVHRLAENRKLILCGVEIPYGKGLLGHSDADVAIHALIDALMGAAGLGDIGMHFSDKDPIYTDISSLTLLEATIDMLKKKGLCPANVDITIVAQEPKLSAYKDKMKATVAKALSISEDRVNIKAKTTEGLGFEGESVGISAHAVALIN